MYCGVQMTKAGMSKHLQSCTKRKELLSAGTSGSGRGGSFYHLLIEDAWEGNFWLRLEMSGKARLAVLDDYLRAIWLECCGHLSQFSLGNWRNEISMDRKALEVFEPGVELIHIYDFGTSSETKIKVVSEREGRATTPHPIALMARNDPPEISCIQCGKPASWLCLECLYDYEREGTFCDKHAKAHPHVNYEGPMPLVNSPRVGMCGYVGPAEPPY
ncbi:MAG: hypothetical protein D6743_04700 [Calditrichaeota bacterium]|nr:MAG: hypothetical protein D6743_04700 [Calditrichota bacterium]